MTDLTAAGSRTLPQRTHPISPIARALTALPGIAVGAIALGASIGSKIGAVVPLAIAAVVGLLVLIAATGYLSWTRLTYWFDDDGDLRIDSGVVTRQERRLQLSRLQTVDIVRPFVVRLFGLSEVRIEVAGDGESRAILQYLTEADADALRTDLLTRAAAHHADTTAPREAIDSIGEEHLIATVPNGRLAISLLLRGATVGLVLLTVLVIAVTVLQAGPAALIVVLITGGFPLLSLVGEYVKYHDFTIAESRDGLRLRHGLTQTQSQTVPPGRVQAIELMSPLLWHRRNWVRVNLNIAGVGVTADRNGQSVVESVLVPVAPRDEALRIVARVLPGVDLDAIELTGVPETARWRAPFPWRRLAAGNDDHVFITRRGWLTHRLAVIPHARTQSVRVQQGPWEKRLGLASMHVDSTRGPVTIAAYLRPAAQAREMAEQQAVRAEIARRSDG